ncbi:hypothetical protein AB0L74_31555 [Streptomyces sp. NPDC052020]|uniref:hypothetical protein n=1 Tax=Streptomyces sp. NPDC052020 TaxID=3155677 RepID=UPI00344998DC
MLNEWDPVGVADVVGDEYDCMLAPLLGRLYGGAGEREVGEFLRHELEDHFGLGAGGLRSDVMAARVVAWWVSAGGAGGAGGQPFPRGAV